MPKYKINYIDINQTLKALRDQVICSIDYCITELPTFETPEIMFRMLKTLITYKSDPPGTELLQSVPTLLTSANYWGKPGYGDCDCFSILVLSCGIANRYERQRIVLAGRSKLAPVHIWTEIYFNGDWQIMDLTQPIFNTKRKYKFVQYINV